MKPILQNSREVILSSSDGTLLVVDKALVILDYAHYEVHAGNTFFTSYTSPEGGDLADNGLNGILLATGAKTLHCMFEFSGGGDVEQVVFEEPGITTGSSQALYNLVRDSSKTSTVQAWRCDTVSITGTMIEHSWIPGGTGGNSTGGTGGIGTEWNFAPNSFYLLGGINRGGQAKVASLKVQWYEE